MRILWRVLVGLVLVAAIIGIGLYAYNIGIAQGLAQKVPVPAVGPAQIPYLGYGYPFFGFGFGFLGCLVPLFLFFLVFGSMRALFWHGPIAWRLMQGRRWGWHDQNDKDIPPFFEEWHRRAHGNPEDKPAEK